MDQITVHEVTLREAAARLPYARLFMTVSGAHLYGFPSADSDFDLRGAHVLPSTAVLGLDQPRETLEVAEVRGGTHVELVTHDVKKYFKLLLNRNGYVLEQIFSPLVIETVDDHEALKAIAKTCITRGHAAHYLGFADQQWRLLERRGTSAKLGPTVKAVLYVYRVLLTGIHLMRTGAVEANLLLLNEEFSLRQIPGLVERKMAGSEAELLSSSELASHEREYHRLRGVLEEAGSTSRLPDQPGGRDALNALLLRVRAEMGS